MRHLRFFESAARLGCFSTAARELHTTQSSVSRTVSDLERMLGTKLFDRAHRSVRLTRSGGLYREAVAASLDRLVATGRLLTEANEPVVIATSHRISMLFLMPLREVLYQTVGGADTHVHILTCDSALLGRVGEHEADLVLSCDPGGASGDRAVAFRQAVRPVCAPGYAREQSGVLDRPAREWEWGGLTILDSARPGQDWATWEDWFEATGRPDSEPRRRTYFDYVFLLEDTVAGKGLALGWRRLIDRHLESGMLVAVEDGFVEVDRPLYARLTERGRHRRHARRCLQLFDDLSRRADAA